MPEPITISSIRIKSLEITRDEIGVPKASGQYEIIGSNGRVFATQGFNSYGGMTIPLSLPAVTGLQAAIDAVGKEISALMGLPTT